MSFLKLSTLTLLFFFGVNEGKSECPYSVLDQAKVSEELLKDIGMIIQISDPDKKRQLSSDKCKEIAQKILSRYFELARSYEEAYRQYRIDHLSKIFKGSPDDKKMVIMTRLARDMGGKELIEKFLKKEKKLETQGSSLSSKAYEKLRDSVEKDKEEIETLIMTRYKSMLRTHNEHPAGNPFSTFEAKIKCESKYETEQSLPMMVSNDVQISPQNPCVDGYGNRISYPKESSRLMINADNGKVVIWHCAQKYKITVNQKKIIKGAYVEKIESSADCLGYDVVSGRYLDKHSLNIREDDPRLAYVDRMEQYYVQKGYDKSAPLLTRAQLVASMGKNDLNFDQFFDLNFPQNCKRWTSIKSGLKYHHSL